MTAATPDQILALAGSTPYGRNISVSETVCKVSAVQQNRLKSPREWLAAANQEETP
jgi:hypothetical protein